MNWKNEAVERLQTYAAKERSVNSMLAELKRLEKEAFRIRSASGDLSGVHGDVSRGDDRLINNIMERQELLWALESTQDWMKNTRRAMQVLNDQEKTVLRELLIYPRTGNLEKICARFGIETSTVYRRREAALRKFTMALYGGVDT